MGNSSSHSTLPHNAADRKKSLTSETVVRADVSPCDCTDDPKDLPSPTGILRNAFCSRLLLRNGEMLDYVAWLQLSASCRALRHMFRVVQGKDGQKKNYLVASRCSDNPQLREWASTPIAMILSQQ